MTAIVAIAAASAAVIGANADVRLLIVVVAPATTLPAIAPPQSRDPPQLNPSSTNIAPQSIVGGDAVPAVFIVNAAAPTTIPPTLS